MTDSIRIETPSDERPPRVTGARTAAAGFPAVWHALSHVASAPLRGARALLGLNQKRGYDCPGCAWPDPDGERHVAEFCENGAKAIAEETTASRAAPERFGAWSLAQLSALSDYRLGRLGRFTEPMILRGDRYTRIGWEDAFGMIAKALSSAAPNESVFYTSGKASNEAAFLFQLLARVLGTNNLPDCSNMCHESSGHALLKTLGSGKGSVTLEDFDHADLILIIGQNPGTNHPRMLTALQRAVRNGCKIVSINPLKEAGLTAFMNPQEIGGMLGIATPLSSIHLPVRINGDVAVLKGIIKSVLEAGALDREFIERYTEGHEAFRADAEKTAWDAITESSGIARGAIEEVARAVAKSERLITCWAMGLTQHRNAVDNIEEIVNLHLLRGQLGKKGAGVCPVRGHSNVQGDRTMGIWEQMPESFLTALGREFGFTAPTARGHDTVAAIEAMHAGKVRNFISLGGNFQAATPDTAYVSEALRKLELSVHISTKPHRGHLVTGRCSLILPCLGRTELDRRKSGPQFVTTENSMGVVERSEGRITPASPLLRSESAIIAGIGQALFPEGPIDWSSLTDDYDRIRDRIEKVIPGFERFNERIRKDRYFYLPHAVRDERRFNTPSGKAHFTVHEIPESPLKKPEEFLLTTLRSHDQFNTTIYGEDDRYRGIHGGRRVIFMNAEDIAARGLVAGERVDITSHFRGERRKVERFAIVPYEIPRRCVGAYFPETNPLAQIGNVAAGSRQPVYKSLVVTLERSTG